MSKTSCDRCGDEFVPDGCGTGYCTIGTAKICYLCADESLRAEMRAGRTMTVYLSGDGSELHSWSGGALATVTVEHERPCGGFCHRSTRTHVWATGEGRAWYGTGPGRGMYLNMRPLKAR